MMFAFQLKEMAAEDEIVLEWNRSATDCEDLDQPANAAPVNIMYRSGKVLQPYIPLTLLFCKPVPEGLRYNKLAPAGLEDYTIARRMVSPADTDSVVQNMSVMPVDGENIPADNRRSIQEIRERQMEANKLVAQLRDQVKGERCRNQILWMGNLSYIFHHRQIPSKPSESRSFISLECCPTIGSINIKNKFIGAGFDPTCSKTPFIQPLHLREVRASFLRESCVKVSVYGDGLEDVINDTMIRHLPYLPKNSFFLHWNIDFKNLLIEGAILVDSGGGVWWAFLPKCPELFFKELTQHVPQVIDEIFQTVAFRSLTPTGLSIMALCFENLRQETARGKEMFAAQPFPKAAFKRILGRKQDVMSLPEAPEDIHWFGLLRFLGLFNCATIRWFSCSAWITVSTSLLQRLNTTPLEGEEEWEKRPRYEAPPHQFWSELPKYQLLAVHTPNKFREEFIKNWRAKKRLMSADDSPIPTFCLELGSLPRHLVQEAFGELGKGGPLVPVRYTCANIKQLWLLEYDSIIDKVVVFVLPRPISICIYKMFKSEIAKTGCANSDLMIQYNGAVTVPLGGELYIQSLLFYNIEVKPKLPLPPAKVERVRWSGEVITLSPTTNKAVPTHFFMEQEFLQLLAQQSNGWTHWSQTFDLGALRNRPFKSPTHHEVYWRRGAITEPVPGGPGLQLFDLVPARSSLVLMVVNNKIIEKIFPQVKKCGEFKLHLQDRAVANQNIYIASNYTSFFVGLFLPEEVSLLQFFQQSAPTVANSLMLFKINVNEQSIHGYYSNIPAKRRKLYDVVMVPDRKKTTLKSYLSELKEYQDALPKKTKKSTATGSVSNNNSASSASKNDSCNKASSNISDATNNDKTNTSKTGDSSSRKKGSKETTTSSSKKGSKETTTTRSNSSSSSNSSSRSNSIGQLTLEEKENGEDGMSKGGDESDAGKKKRYDALCWYCSAEEGDLDSKGNTVMLSKCFGCMRARYCGAACHKQDWSTHGGWCKKKQEKRAAKESKAPEIPEIHLD